MEGELSMYYQDPYNREQELIKDVEKAINGEYSAIQCYERLAGMTKDSKERNRILEIRQDEIKHFTAFSGIYEALTGTKPTPQIIGFCPTKYLAGLEASIIDEQETVDDYLNIAQTAENRMIKKAFRDAATDEQNHAVWFLYFYTKNK